jgi:hypothetical protein
MNSSTTKLSHGENWISDEFNVKFSDPGYNQTIIAELWETNIGPDDKFWEVLTMHLNVTS